MTTKKELRETIEQLYEVKKTKVMQYYELYKDLARGDIERIRERVMKEHVHFHGHEKRIYLNEDTYYIFDSPQNIYNEEIEEFKGKFESLDAKEDKAIEELKRKRIWLLSEVALSGVTEELKDRIRRAFE